ncbi:MAG: ABC transporter ATP-binding protein [Thermoanaerobaculia bacterium]
MEPAVELSGVEKSYGDFRAVSALSLTVPAGTVYGMLGPNGAGKTTTLRMLMDIVPPDAGEVRLFGHRRTRADLQRVGYLPEERGLYRKMRVAEQLAFLGELHGLAQAEARARAERWLERLGLSQWARSKVEELSKGMQQKVQLAGTVLHEPDLLILDEPFSGLDPLNQSLLKEVLAEYTAGGRTVVFSTHVMEQAEKLCDRICLISRGRVVLDGELTDIKRRHGGNAWRLAGRGDLARLRQIAGIEDLQIHDGAARLFLVDGVAGHDVLRRAVEVVEVTEFRSAEPDLEEIFVKVVHDAG